MWKVSGKIDLENGYLLRSTNEDASEAERHSSGGNTFHRDG